MLQRWHLRGVLGALGALRTLGVLGFLTLGSITVVHASDGRSMGPSQVQADKAVVSERFLSSTKAAHRINAEPWVAPVVSADDAAKARAIADGERAKPLQIGFPRDIAATARELPMAALQWQALGDGSRAVQIDVSASAAAAFRVGYHIAGPESGLQIRFAGSGRDEVYLGDAVSREVAWSPVLEGDAATLELRLLPGFEASQFQVSLTQVSHFIISPADFGRKDVAQIGRSDSCNIDVACVSSPSAALLSAARATAKMVFTTSRGSFLCSGTLLNSSSGANYFFSAAHCISDQASASTLNTYWFFDAASCGSTAIPAYQLVTGGSTLRVTDVTLDVTLLELRQSPPTGAVRAGWDATVVLTGGEVQALHHPSGDLKKFSRGTALGYAQGPAAYGSVPRTQAGKDSFITVRWTAGTTEGGSSGSGVFTLNPSCAGGAPCYQLRGGLEGGAASCANPSGIDRYSRMDLLYTKLAPYLNPSSVIPSNTTTQSSMVEYFNPQFDFYFMSSKEGEKAALDGAVDANANTLWYRTGYWFKTDPTTSAGTSPLRRYFIPGAAKGASRGTHFYSALSSDWNSITATGRERFSAGCAGVPNSFFCNEGIDSFVALPIGTGATAQCFSDERPIYRVFRAAPRYPDDGNHRYLSSLAMYNYMVNDQGWSAESINLCARQ